MKISFDIGGFLSRVVLDGKISKRCEVYALVGSLCNIVNRLFTGTTDDVDAAFSA